MFVLSGPEFVFKDSVSDQYGLLMMMVQNSGHVSVMEIIKRPQQVGIDGVLTSFYF